MIKNYLSRISLLTVVLLIFAMSTSGQSPISTLHVKRGNQSASSSAASPAPAITVRPFFVASAAPGITDHSDVQTFPTTHVQAEVHISINRQTPTILVASSNTYLNNNYNQGRYVSTDGGFSWAGSETLNANNPTVDGDPSTAIDANGNIYISTITETANGYYVTKSVNNGAVFGNLVQGVTTAAGDFDKEMIVADNLPASPNVNNLYCAWTTFTSATTSIVNFNRSTNGGTIFSAAAALKNGPGQGTNVQTGPNGEVYVCYADYGPNNYVFPANGLGFVRSLDGGVTFAAARVAVPYVGIRKSGSGIDPAFNNIGTNDFPSMAVDKSGQAHNGRIYAVFAAQLNGNGKAVIEITHSDNRGDTWTAPTAISLSTATESFFPWVCVDQVTGGLYVAYYSIDGSGFQTNTYVGISNDGGTTFITQKVSDVSHVTQPINNTIFRTGYQGDYIGVTAQGGKAYVAWMDQRSGSWQIYVSEVDNTPVITGVTAFCT